MREFATFLPRFWVTGPGKKFRGDPAAQLVTAYLFTAPGSNHIGIYYLPVSTISHDTGLIEEGAWKGLQRAIEGGFCLYDETSEHVFVVEMAKIQILERAEALNPKDKKVKGIHKEVHKYRESVLYPEFFKRYRDAFYLEELEPLQGGLEAPPKGHFVKRQETGNRNREGNYARAREAPLLNFSTPSQLNEMFDSERRSAGHGPYSPKKADERHARDAMADVKAVAEDKGVSEQEVVHRSMHNYFLHADKGLRQKGFPFWGWAKSVAHFYDENNHRAQAQPGDRSKWKNARDDSAEIIALTTPKTMETNND